MHLVTGNTKVTVHLRETGGVGVTVTNIPVQVLFGSSILATASVIPVLSVSANSSSEAALVFAASRGRPVGADGKHDVQRGTLTEDLFVVGLSSEAMEIRNLEEEATAHGEIVAPVWNQPAVFETGFLEYRSVAGVEDRSRHEFVRG